MTEPLYENLVDPGQLTYLRSMDGSGATALAAHLVTAITNASQRGEWGFTKVGAGRPEPTAIVISARRSDRYEARIQASARVTPAHMPAGLAANLHPPEPRGLAQVIQVDDPARMLEAGRSIEGTPDIVIFDHLSDASPQAVDELIRWTNLGTAVVVIPPQGLSRDDASAFARMKATADVAIEIRGSDLRYKYRGEQRDLHLDIVNLDGLPVAAVPRQRRRDLPPKRDLIELQIQAIEAVRAKAISTNELTEQLVDAGWSWPAATEAIAGLVIPAKHVPAVLVSERGGANLNVNTRTDDRFGRVNIVEHRLRMLKEQLKATDSRASHLRVEPGIHSITPAN